MARRSTSTDGGHRFSFGTGSSVSRIKSAATSSLGRIGTVLITILSYILFPLFLAIELLSALYGFFTSKVGFTMLVIGFGLLAVGPLGLVSVNVDDLARPVGNFTDDTNVSGPTPASSSSAGWDKDSVERYFIMYLNQERASRGLQNVSDRGVLAEMGEAHSENMVQNDYFDHVEPDGTTIEDRYRSRGLLPECRLPRKDDTYYPGAENIAKTHVNTNVVMDNGSTVYITSERELAKHLFTMWLNSKGHREAMLVYSADEAGLGLAFDNSEVYASLELC